MSHPRPEPFELSVSEAAAVLGIHGDTLRRWTDAGKVPSWTTPSGHRRFRRSDLEALLAGTAPTAGGAS